MLSFAQIGTNNPPKNWCEASGYAVLASRSHVLRRRVRRSENQHVILMEGGANSDVFNLVLIMVAQLVKAQAVHFRVDQFGQLGLEYGVLCGIQKAFKYGVLHPLPVVYALFGNFAQALAPGGGFGAHVISNQHKHGEPHFQKNGG